jgi:hypothetical protein
MRALVQQQPQLVMMLQSNADTGEADDGVGTSARGIPGSSGPSGGINNSSSGTSGNSSHSGNSGAPATTEAEAVINRISISVDATGGDAASSGTSPNGSGQETILLLFA